MQLPISTNWYPFLHHFQVIADYWPNLCFRCGRWKTPELRTMKFGLRTLETALYDVVQNAFRYVELFRRGSQVWWTDGQTDMATRLWWTERAAITGSAVALHCCKAHSKINRKMPNSTPCKIVTPKNFILKLCTRDYVGEITRHANFRFNRSSGGFSPNRRNITTLWLFLTVLSCPVLTFFSWSYARSNRWTDFHAWWLKRRVSAQGWSFWGLERWVTIFGGNMPPKLSKNGLEKAISSQNVKNIKIAISPKL